MKIDGFKKIFIAAFFTTMIQLFFCMFVWDIFLVTYLDFSPLGGTPNSIILVILLFLFNIKFIEILEIKSK